MLCCSVTCCREVKQHKAAEKLREYQEKERDRMAVSRDTCTVRQ